MIQPKELFDALSARDIGFYAGVPDSLLANFCSYVDDHCGRLMHLITANEGNAVALAIGYHMSTGKYAAVYMQNSGLGNTVNPLTSLADPEVYKVPMLLIVGWRGEPGSKDEPQHVKQGRITLDQLKVLEIPYYVLDSSSNVRTVLDSAFIEMISGGVPVALVVRKNTFADYSAQRKRRENSTLTRESALKQILVLSDKNDLIVSTTGKTSREVFEIRQVLGQSQRDFLTVGGMGHASSIALGVAIGQPDRRVVCLDGDGALLMHMGALPIISDYSPQRFVHVLLNNESHESVGGQATSASKINFQKLSDAVGYTGYALVTDTESIRTAWEKFQNVIGPVLIEVKIKNGSRSDLGRPTTTAEQNKFAFMEAAGVQI